MPETLESIIDYCILLSFEEEGGSLKVKENIEGFVHIYAEEPWFWDPYNYYVSHGEKAEAQDTEPLLNETPCSAVSSSTSPAAHNIVATEPVEAPGSQNVEPSTIPGKNASTANLPSCSSSASPPPASPKAYLWFKFEKFEAHCTCELETLTSNPTNFKCYDVFHPYLDVPVDIAVYLEDPELENKSVVDDNGNPFLIGHIRWASDDTGLGKSIKAYGKRVTKDVKEPRLTANEKKRTMKHNRVGLGKENSGEKASA